MLFTHDQIVFLSSLFYFKVMSVVIGEGVVMGNCSYCCNARSEGVKIHFSCCDRA